MIIFIFSETPFSCLKIIMWTLRTNNPKLESHQNGSCLDSFISVRVCVHQELLEFWEQDLFLSQGLGCMEWSRAEPGALPLLSVCAVTAPKPGLGGLVL